MSIWIIVLLIIITVICYMLFAPFYFEIDSDKNIYQVRFHRIAYASLNFDENSFQLDLKIIGWQKQINLFEKKEVQLRPMRREERKRRTEFSFRKIKNVIQSFHVKTLLLSIDTGNEPLNGLLFPLFFWLSRLSRKSLSINFQGNNRLVLQVENNMARIIWAYISS